MPVALKDFPRDISYLPWVRTEMFITKINFFSDKIKFEIEDKFLWEKFIIKDALKWTHGGTF